MLEFDSGNFFAVCAVFIQMSYMMYKCCGYCTLQELFL